MITELEELLKVLNESLDPEKQNEIEELHRKSLTWQAVERLPLIMSFPYPDSDRVRPFPHHEIFDDPEKMLFNEFMHAFDTSIFLHPEVDDDLPYTVRANFGTIIIASLFGGRVEQRGDNPPWILPFKTFDEFKTIFEKDPLDFSQGICPGVIGRYEFYRDILADYPNLKKCIKIVLPDLQGPLDTLELLRGSIIYEDFIINAEMVDKGLRLIAKAQVGFARHLQQLLTDSREGFSHQHAVTIIGDILIRNDLPQLTGNILIKLVEITTNSEII